MLNTKHLILVFILLLTPFSGCLSHNSPQANGRLQIKFNLVEKSTIKVAALAENIKIISVLLEHETKNITQNKESDFTASNPEITFNSLYPGKWKVTLSAKDAVGDVIFQGNTEVTIDSNTTTNTQIIMTPAPGFLDVTFDASQIPGFNSSTKGTFYIYLDPDNSSAKYYSMTVKGIYLQTNFSVPEGTYQVKLAIPNVNDAVYLSLYYTINIQAGKTTYISISPSGSITTSVIINSTPATPAQLNAIYQKDVAIVLLSWQAVADSDLKSYRIYRTNSSGRFVKLVELDKNVVSYSNAVTSSNFHVDQIGYAVSSVDLGGNESFWSEAVYINK